ncbi:MAG: type II toxin-antitoxin system VapC family toxin [Bacteroidetes bacterium]|nr:MAG: type II toxin-antitoxin system VapC family toxin [Bacteroidota bacterium]
MNQAILDTDTVSYYFRKNPIVVQKVDAYLKSFGFINISVVTYYEVMNGLLYKDAKRQLPTFERFVELNHVIPLTLEVAKSASVIFASLRKRGITIGHNDVMIAACAISNNLTLITNNTHHFSKIKGLEIDNWPPK